ncbi:MAG: metallophosphoesterase family protein [Devosia sp.]
MLANLKAILAWRNATLEMEPRARLRRAAWPAVVYAIGDVHGCLSQLRDIEALIAADAVDFPGEKLIVTLGDHVDRGPDSAGVLDYLLSPPPAGFERICLAGNHDVMMADFMARPSATDDWMRMGGDVTLRSYGLRPSRLAAMSEAARRTALRNHIPREHIEFLQQMPLLLELPGVVFVHAGIRRGVPLEAQREDDLLWMRPEKSDGKPSDGLVVHGHIPGAEPILTNGRVCVDTAVFATGKLTAIRLGRDSSYRVIQSFG